MSDSGYPQSEHSGSVNSRRTFFENRSRSQPYPIVKPTIMNNEVSISQGHQNMSKHSTISGPTQNIHENNVLLINGEKETYAHIPRSSLYSDVQNSVSNAMPVGYGGWHPDRYLSRQSTGQSIERMGDEARKKAQIQAYIAWVNVQLKKKAGSRAIEELTTDLQDGVALSDLIEIVAGEPLEGIFSTPQSFEEMVQNVEKVLYFMHTRRIRMHHTTAKDIVEGNTKSIMRLILALAAHFKPNSVKQSSFAKSARGDTMAGIAQGAAAALADARKDVANVINRPRRPKYLQDRCQQGSETGSDSDHPTSSSQLSQRGVLDGASSSASPLPTSFHSPRSNGVGSSPRSRTPQNLHQFTPGRETSTRVPKSKSVDFSQEPVENSSESSHISSQLLNTLTKEHTELAGEMFSTKNTLLLLQDLLLSGRVPDGEESPSIKIEAGNPEDEVVILRSKLQQSEELVKSLREDLSNVRNEGMQLQGVKSGLQQRLSEQEHSFLVMKADLLRAGFRQQTLENTKAELEHKLVERDKLVLDLRRDLAKREREIDELKANFQVEQQQRDATARALRSQIQDLHGKLQKVGETEATLSARVASQDRKMARLEGKIMQSQYETGSTSTRPSSGRSTHSTSSDDVQIVKDNLHSLRTHFHTNDSQHEAIDELECSISVLMDRLQMSETDPPKSGGSSNRDKNRKPNYDSTGDTRRSPLSAIHGFPAHRLDNPSNGKNSTKILYFTDRTVTPFMCSVPKRLGEITLRDVKTVIDRPGNYRYHFKAMDPEFGTVKEEIVHEDNIIPGWEGKIVAWVEEDHG